jgi:hypothetical protein
MLIRKRELVQTWSVDNHNTDHIGAQDTDTSVDAPGTETLVKDRGCLRPCRQPKEPLEQTRSGGQHFTRNSLLPCLSLSFNRVTAKAEINGQNFF